MGMSNTLLIDSIKYQVEQVEELDTNYGLNEKQMEQLYSILYMLSEVNDGQA